MSTEARVAGLEGRYGDPGDALADAIMELVSRHQQRLANDPGLLGRLIEHVTATIDASMSEVGTGARWLYFRIGSEVKRGKEMIANEIAPMLGDVRRTYEINGWWWLYKSDRLGPAIRLRIFVPHLLLRPVEEAIRSRLTMMGREFKVLCYEPELLLFGGAHGMEAAHEFFCADSAFLAAWNENDPCAIGSLLPEGLSIALVLKMVQSAGLDLFERWDVFDRVAQKRIFGSCTDRRFPYYQELARKVINAGPHEVFRLFSGDRSRLLMEHVAFLDRFGGKMTSLYINGLLRCGLREFYAPLILFHWNRLLLPPFAHFGISHAIAQQLGRLSREGSGTVNRGEAR